MFALVRMKSVVAREERAGIFTRPAGGRGARDGADDSKEPSGVCQAEGV
jgi:hypothetical protein